MSIEKDIHTPNDGHEIAANKASDKFDLADSDEVAAKMESEDRHKKDSSEDPVKSHSEKSDDGKTEPNKDTSPSEINDSQLTVVNNPAETGNEHVSHPESDLHLNREEQQIASPSTNESIGDVESDRKLSSEEGEHRAPSEQPPDDKHEASSVESDRGITTDQRNPDESSHGTVNNTERHNVESDYKLEPDSQNSKTVNNVDLSENPPDRKENTSNNIEANDRKDAVQNNVSSVDSEKSLTSNNTESNVQGEKLPVEKNDLENSEPRIEDHKTENPKNVDKNEHIDDSVRNNAETGSLEKDVRGERTEVASDQPRFESEAPAKESENKSFDTSEQKEPNVETDYWEYDWNTDNPVPNDNEASDRLSYEQPSEGKEPEKIAEPGSETKDQTANDAVNPDKTYADSEGSVERKERFEDYSSAELSDMVRNDPETVRELNDDYRDRVDAKALGYDNVDEYKAHLQRIEDANAPDVSSKSYGKKTDVSEPQLDRHNEYVEETRTDKYMAKLGDSNPLQEKYSVEGMSQSDIRRINIEASDVGTVSTWENFKEDVRNQEKYMTLYEAKNAYCRVVIDQSPWVDGENPKYMELPKGTYFEMAMSKEQPDHRPGAFGTLDHIKDNEFVRDNLAVKQDWKPDIDRINTYEVIHSLPVNYGEVGPQVDIPANRYLYGGASQIEMKVPPHERMNYIVLVDSRKVE